VFDEPAPEAASHVVRVDVELTQVQRLVAPPVQRERDRHVLAVGEHPDPRVGDRTGDLVAGQPLEVTRQPDLRA
jgi:hypothetical protein